MRVQVVGKALETSLRISNPGDSSVVFKVKTTAPKRYCVKPNCCLVNPGERVSVKIIMQALKEIPPPELLWKDKFLIQAGSTNVTAGDAKQLFEALDKGALVDQKLLCTFNNPDDDKAPAPLHEEMTRAVGKSAPQREASPVQASPEKASDASAQDTVLHERRRAESLREDVFKAQKRNKELQEQIELEKSQHRKGLRTIEDLQTKFETLHAEHSKNKGMKPTRASPVLMHASVDARARMCCVCARECTQAHGLVGVGACAWHAGIR